MDKETITITIDLVNNTYNARPMTPELALAALILMRTGLGLRHVAELLLVNKGSMKSAVEKLTSADFRQPVAAEERNNNEDHGEDTGSTTKPTARATSTASTTRSSRSASPRTKDKSTRRYVIRLAELSLMATLNGI
jgi:hypothetical protein